MDIEKYKNGSELLEEKLTKYKESARTILSELENVAIGVGLDGANDMLARVDEYYKDSVNHISYTLFMELINDGYKDIVRRYGKPIKADDIMNIKIALNVCNDVMDFVNSI